MVKCRVYKKINIIKKWKILIRNKNVYFTISTISQHLLINSQHLKIIMPNFVERSLIATIENILKKVGQYKMNVKYIFILFNWKITKYQNIYKNDVHCIINISKYRRYVNFLRNKIMLLSLSGILCSKLNMETENWKLTWHKNILRHKLK